MPERPSESRVTAIEARFQDQTINEQCLHPVTVTHPSQGGKMGEWEVMIEKIFLRHEDSVERVGFRGRCTIGEWSGTKSFFADNCVSFYDCVDRVYISDVVSWLKNLKDPIAPLTLASVINSLIIFLKKEFDIKIESSRIENSPRGTKVILENIANDDNSEENIHFWLNGQKIIDNQIDLGTDNLTIELWDGDDEPTVDERFENGVQIRSETIPSSLADVVCIPCAGNRVIVRRN